MSVILETIKLERTFGAVVAASDINIKIHSGEVVGVIGSNGAGKTTFVNMVTGYLPPSSGNILYRGDDITGKPTRDITRLGICRSFQIPQLFLELSALDNILIALTIAKQKQPNLLKPAVNSALVDEAMDILKRFSIDQYASQETGTLAQGVRKLIDIAMATVGKPNLLFLDEPTSGVSADEKMQIMDVLMRALQSSDTAVLFIEHDMEIIEAFAPRVAAFYEGTILVDAATEEVLANDKVREFIIGKEVHRQSKNNRSDDEVSLC